PGNVIVQPDGTLVLVDFGIAKAAEELAAAGSDAVSAAVSLAAPAYLAPEQFSGRPVSARTDIYALGCVTYEMLTGQPPFVGTTFESLAHAHANEPPAPLHERNPLLPVELSRVLDVALAKNPENRYESAAVFAE